MKFDAIIIGSGQAGTPLAFKMAAKGKKVAFIEKEHLGGTCLNVGCTPTKTYVASARRMFDAHNGEMLGVHIPEGTRINLSQVKKRKDELIKKSVDGMAAGIEKNENITLFKGAARFTDSHTVEVNGKVLSAEKIYINVGARPLVPEGLKKVNFLTNQSILELEQLPEHLIIIGGSYIGLEFGQMFRRFGSKVTIIEKSDRIISREDKDVSREIQRVMEREGVVFRLNATCIDAQEEKDGQLLVSVSCEKGAPQIRGSHVLVAVGRIPNTAELDLGKAGIKTDGRGYIQVNDTLETNISGIFALGDCNGKGAFTHTAYNDFEIINSNLFEQGNRKVSDRILTYGLFVDPPLGRAGITLKEAKDQNLEVLVGYRDMKRIARAKEKGETDGFIRVIVDKKTEKILGAAVLGVGGDEIISSILNVMYGGLSYTVIRDGVFPHPTVGELIPTLLESLEPI
ncbi:FAD-containing oxidoreductase [Cyclobacterium sp.]|uniref:FAD-containing oxidoreductase n=1 Tax=Cyclobacterium sp. TaxID=1966343 RepID=UPI0019B2B527|nr:FAD-containing oxidoreductase [Cyclobacterium sp.]MBD3630618.1 FAD-containing oxidoreductase [Cyclobacterium sp.]